MTDMPKELFIRPTHGDGKHFSCSTEQDNYERLRYVRDDSYVPQIKNIIFFSGKQIAICPKQGILRACEAALVCREFARQHGISARCVKIKSDIPEEGLATWNFQENKN